jgi:hypothetical protein
LDPAAVIRPQGLRLPAPAGRIGKQSFAQKVQMGYGDTRDHGRVTDLEDLAPVALTEAG